jgi:Ca2+-binding EF-hand superfamily protein
VWLSQTRNWISNDIYLSLDKNGEIDFSEFMKALRAPLNKIRIEALDEAFAKLDTNSETFLIQTFPIQF